MNNSHSTSGERANGERTNGNDKPTILYVPEFKDQLPKKVEEAYHIVRIHTPLQAIREIELAKHFDAYILGIVTASNDSEVEILYKTYEAKIALGDEIIKATQEGSSERFSLQKQWDALEAEIRRQLDYRGGIDVYDSLDMHGIIGRVPVLFYTRDNQHTGRVRTDDILKLGKIEKPGHEQEILDWLAHSLKAKSN